MHTRPTRRCRSFNSKNHVSWGSLFITIGNTSADVDSPHSPPPRRAIATQFLGSNHDEADSVQPASPHSESPSSYGLCCGPPSLVFTSLYLVRTQCSATPQVIRRPLRARTREFVRILHLIRFALDSFGFVVGRRGVTWMPQRALLPCSQKT